MKLFEKPWLEIIDINLNDIVATSVNDMGAETNESEMPEGGDNQQQ